MERTGAARATAHAARRKLEALFVGFPPLPPCFGVDLVLLAADRGQVAGNVGPHLARRLIQNVEQGVDGVGLLGLS